MSPPCRRMAALVLAAVPMAACARERPAPAPVAEAAPRRVATARVSRGQEGRTSVPGTVIARERAALAARVPAAVVALPYREGDRVSEGAVVVRLDDRALRSAVSAAEAALAAAEADETRTRSLREKGVVTVRDAEEAGARAAGARSALAAVRDALSYAVLRAPFHGTLSARRVHVGDVVSPGLPLVEVEGDVGLEVRATIDGAAAAQVRAGQHVSVDVDGARTLDAVIRSLSPAGDAATHRFDVRADLPRAPGVRSGAFARLWLPGAGGDARLLVPGSAVFQRGGLAGVFIVQQGRARLRWIAAGDTSAGLTEIRAGAAEGETVVLDPAGLADGVRVDEAS